MFANCEICGKYARLNGYGCCEACSKTDEDLINAARSYILTHRQVSIDDVSEALGIDLVRIQRWLQQGRLRTGSKWKICAKCGQPSVDEVCGCKAEIPATSRRESRFHSVPRRVQAKWEYYWNHVSSVQRHSHRRIWLTR